MVFPTLALSINTSGTSAPRLFTVDFNRCHILSGHQELIKSVFTTCFCHPTLHNFLHLSGASLLFLFVVDLTSREHVHSMSRMIAVSFAGFRQVTPLSCPSQIRALDRAEKFKPALFSLKELHHTRQLGLKLVVPISTPTVATRAHSPMHAASPRSV